MKKALEGVKILSLTQFLTAPFTQMVLSDLGAEIIKVERPVTGDGSRAIGPYVNGESTYYASLNRNAQSVVINFEKPEGIGIIKELVKICDVLIENFRPRVMSRFGLGYEDLKKINPRIVYTTITGFGHDDIIPSPYCERLAYDLVSQAMGGLMAINGPEGGLPTKVGVGIGDIVPGLFAAVGTISALRVAERTGQGQHVDVAMVDSIMCILENSIQMYTHQGIIRNPIGSRHHALAPFNSYRCKDGWIVIAIANEKLWANLCRALGREAWIADPLFTGNDNRVKNYDAYIHPWIEAWTSERTKAEADTHLAGYDVPVGPVLNTKEIVESPHTVSRQMLVEVDHPVIGKEQLVNSPIKMSLTMPGIETPAPTLGQHTETVLAHYLHYQPEKIAALRQEGVIG